MMVLLIVALVVVVGVVVAVVVGKVGSDSLAEPSRSSAFELPEGELRARDLGQVRFEQSLRGYNMTQVDAVLDKLSAQLDVLESREREREAAQRDADAEARPAGSIVQFRTRRGDGQRAGQE